MDEKKREEKDVEVTEHEVTQLDNEEIEDVAGGFLDNGNCGC